MNELSRESGQWQWAAKHNNSVEIMKLPSLHPHYMVSATTLQHTEQLNKHLQLQDSEWE